MRYKIYITGMNLKKSANPINKLLTLTLFFLLGGINHLQAADSYGMECTLRDDSTQKDVGSVNFGFDSGEDGYIKLLNSTLTYQGKNHKIINEENKYYMHFYNTDEAGTVSIYLSAPTKDGPGFSLFIDSLDSSPSAGVESRFGTFSIPSTGVHVSAICGNWGKI